MTKRDWQRRIETASFPPSLDEINRKIEERLTFFENRLRERGIYIICGAEQKFLAHDNNEKPWKDWIEPETIKWCLRDLGVTLLEDVGCQDAQTGKYQITYRIPQKAGFPRSVSLAQELRKVREILPEKLCAMTKVSAISFQSSLDNSPDATAGLHMNLSVCNAAGENLFYDSTLGGVASTLCRKAALELLALQKDGLALYAPDEASYRRFGSHEFAPSELRIDHERSDGSIVLKSDVSKTPDSFRIEDRLAGASTYPYFPLLAGIGAIYMAVTNPKHSINGESCAIIENPELAIKNFEYSALWKEIAGDDLHGDLVAYLKAQTQSRSANLPA